LEQSILTWKSKSYTLDSQPSSAGHRSQSTLLQSLFVSLVLTRFNYVSAPLAGLLRASAIEQTSVCHERSHQTGFLCPEVRSSHSYIERSSLAACTAGNRIPSGGAGWLAVLAFRCQHGMAPSVLCHRSLGVSLTLFPDDTCGRYRRVLVARIYRRKRWTIGVRASPVAAARVWNSLSPVVTQSSSLSNFKGKLNTELLFALLVVLPRFMLCIQFIIHIFGIVTLYSSSALYVSLMPFVFTLHYMFSKVAPRSWNSILSYKCTFLHDFQLLSF